MARLELRLDDLRIEGVSRGGDATWFRVHPPGLAFDVGRGALPLTGAECLFITHGHLDHVLGLPFVLSNRAMQGLTPTRVFCPEPAVPAVSRLVASAQALEEAAYDFELRGLEPGDRVEVGRDLVVEAFAVEHGVPALGFHLIRRRKSLLAEHRERSGDELGELRRKGVTLEARRDELWVTYCGDTGAGVFDLEPRLFSSSVLLLECTFLDGADRESAREYGHLHLADLEEHEDRFANDAIVLHHLTRRHEPEELRRAVERRLPTLADRIHLAA